MYQLELSPMQANWLIGHTAYEDGVGREVYDAVRAAMVRGEVEPPTARPVPMQVIERYEQHREPLSHDVQAVVDVTR